MLRKVNTICLTLIMMGAVIVVLVKITPIVQAPTTLYVGGVGGGNYSKIQWAIDNASDGDTVFVYNGTYNENVIVNKTLNLTGENKEITIIDGGWKGDVLLINSNWVNMTGFTVMKSKNGSEYSGIKLYHVQNCTVYDNNAANNSIGILLDYSSRNNIIGNNASSNRLYGIVLKYSNTNHINNNNASSNKWAGIRLYFSIGNNIIKNTMIWNGIFIFDGNLEHWNTHNIDTSNTVNGKPVYYWKNRTSDIIPGGAGQVILANCTNIEIKNQNITNISVGVSLGFSTMNNITNNHFSYNSYGIYLWYSTWVNVFNNTACNNLWGFMIDLSSNNKFSENIGSNNSVGLYFKSSDNNIISNNNIFKNANGISFYSSLDNLIYHNYFNNNSIHAYDDDPFSTRNQWDKGYPSGGNYWSDYIGEDYYKGPNQDIPGSDGIGDTPYGIATNSWDYYPLMESYKPLDNYTILKQGWNLISIPLIQEEQNLTKVLGSIDSWYDAVQWYDSIDKNDHWKHNKVGKPFGNDLNKLNESMGFWIHITQPGDTIFIYNGTQPTVNQTINLTSGWNLVGYPSLSNKNRTDALNNIDFGSDVDAIWVHNATTQTWKEITVSDNFEVGRGYWIHSKVTKTWIVPL
jgi:parallel beta-helix repeat protein